MSKNLLEKLTSVNYDGITKHLLDNMDDSTMIKFINNTFDRKFSSDSEVVRLATETVDDETNQKRCDYFVKIGDDLFLIEIQSYEDDEMAIRIFEYGSRGAQLHRRRNSDEDIIELQFPEPVVFYLRKEGKIHEKLSVKIRKSGSNEAFDYEARVIYVEDYDFDSLIEKSMLPVIPFYPMRYEKMLKRKHRIQDETEMLKDLTECYEKLKDALKAKKFGYIYFQYISSAMANVFNGLIKRMKEHGNIHNEEEASRVMQKMIDEPIEMFDIFSALEQSKKEGEQIGQKRGEQIGQKRGENLGREQGVKAGKFIYSMLNEGKEDKEIIIKLVDELNISEEEAAELLKQYR